MAGYRQCGEAGLIDTRQMPVRGSQVDPRWDETIRLDLEYVEHHSARLDLIIVARTLAAVVSGRGAY